MTESTHRGRLEGKVALVSGAARGQGRAHCVRFAEEGADIIAFDLCGPVETVRYEPAGPEDLAETVAQVEALDRRIVAGTADVRDVDAVRRIVAKGTGRLGRLDVISAVAGIAGSTSWDAVSDLRWQQMLDINLTGVWNTVRAGVPAILAGDSGGSVILTSSLLGLKGRPNTGPYTAAKHGVIGLMRTLAQELGPRKIRVNALCPGNVATPMILNDATFALYSPDHPDPGIEQMEEINRTTFSAMDVPFLEPVDLANAALWLASEESRYVTGVALPVDTGWHAL